MAAIVSAADYATWRTGSTAVMTGAQFPFYEKKAEKELNRQCFGQLSAVVIAETAASIVVDKLPYALSLEDIKAAICEIAEALFQAEQAQTSGLSSFSNDGQSGSYDQTRFSEAGQQAQIRKIAKSYLSGTVLLRAGVTSLWHG